MFVHRIFSFSPHLYQNFPQKNTMWLGRRITVCKNCPENCPNFRKKDPSESLCQNRAYDSDEEGPLLEDVMSHWANPFYPYRDGGSRFFTLRSLLHWNHPWRSITIDKKKIELDSPINAIDTKKSNSSLGTEGRNQNNSASKDYESDGECQNDSNDSQDCGGGGDGGGD